MARPLKGNRNWLNQRIGRFVREPIKVITAISTAIRIGNKPDISTRLGEALMPTARVNPDTRISAPNNMADTMPVTALVRVVRGLPKAASAIAAKAKVNRGVEKRSASSPAIRVSTTEVSL